MKPEVPPAGHIPPVLGNGVDLLSSQGLFPQPGPTLLFSAHSSIPALQAVINALKDFSMATINLAFPNFQVLYFATLTGFPVKGRVLCPVCF